MGKWLRIFAAVMTVVPEITSVVKSVKSSLKTPAAPTPPAPTPLYGGPTGQN